MVIGRKTKMSLSDTAIVINLLRTAGTHSEHYRIADDLQKQMLNPEKVDG